MSTPPHRSRQFLHLQRQTLARLQEQIPDGCPLAVRFGPNDRGFLVAPVGMLDASAYCVGRYQVTSAFIDGFVRAWRLQA